MKRDLNAVTLRVVIYYAVTVIGMQLLLHYFPETRGFLPVGGIDKLNQDSIFNLASNNPATVEVEQVQVRVLTLLLALLGTVIFTIPLSWVYTITQPKKKHKYNPIIETLYLLPITVAVVVIIVQNSIALAFSLVGIVAAVRFRNTLKTPSDAVFVFASLSIGLAAGVSEIGIAGIGSMVFSLTALGLLHFHVVELETVHEDGGKKHPSEYPRSTTEDAGTVNDNNHHD